MYLPVVTSLIRKEFSTCIWIFLSNILFEVSRGQQGSHCTDLFNLPSFFYCPVCAQNFPINGHLLPSISNHLLYFDLDAYIYPRVTHCMDMFDVHILSN